MKDNNSPETAVASYDLTASKTEHDISDREMNEMLSESGADSEHALKQNRHTHPVFRFFFSHFLWIFACAVIFALCIFCSNRFFETQDKRLLGVTESGTLDITDTETQEQLTIYEKMNILNRYANVTDLNYDSTDKHTYGEVHDLFVTELTSFFGYMDLPFTVNGVYEMYIYKYLFTDSEDSARSFTGWVTYMNYYGFMVNCILDYDTQKILALGISTEENENSYHNSEDLAQLPDYNDYIEPLLTYQEHTYIGCYSSFYTSDKRSENKKLLSAYETLLRTYYKDNSICYYEYGYWGTPSNCSEWTSDSEKLKHISLTSLMRPEDSTNLNYNYYCFSPEDAADEKSSMVIDKFSSYFCFNRMDSY